MSRQDFLDQLGIVLLMIVIGAVLYFVTCAFYEEFDEQETADGETVGLSNGRRIIPLDAAAHFPIRLRCVERFGEAQAEEAAGRSGRRS